MANALRAAGGRPDNQSEVSVICESIRKLHDQIGNIRARMAAADVTSNAGFEFQLEIDRVWDGIIHFIQALGKTPALNPTELIDKSNVFQIIMPEISDNPSTEELLLESILKDIAHIMSETISPAY